MGHLRTTLLPPVGGGDDIPGDYSPEYLRLSARQSVGRLRSTEDQEGLGAQSGLSPSESWIGSVPSALAV